MPRKEHVKFSTFTSSLLSRSSKLSDLISQIESAFGDKSAESLEGKRVTKPLAPTYVVMLWNVVELRSWWYHFQISYHPQLVLIDLRCTEALEQAVETLNAEYGKCDLVKLDTATLRTSTSGADRFLGFHSRGILRCQSLPSMARWEGSPGPRTKISMCDEQGRCNVLHHRSA